MFKRSIQITLGITSLCFATVMFYSAAQEGLLTLSGIVLVACGAFSVDGALAFFWGETTPAKSK